MLEPAVIAPTASSARPDRPVAQLGTLLEVDNLVQEFTIHSPSLGKRVIQAVSGVSFSMERGETLALVGESGCGKSTLARTILHEPRAKSGSVRFRGAELTALRGKELQRARLGIQAVFQDPHGSLDPHWSIRDLVAEPMRVNGIGTKEERTQRADELLDAVGINPAVYGSRRPRELSGGQCQRVAIARALAVGPELLICDEPVSSLDVSVQAQILNLFERLRRERSLSYLFITHDLAVARHVSDRIAFMYLGKVVEIGDASTIYGEARHPYSSALLLSIPDPDLPPGSEVERPELHGDLPSAANPPSGCRFRTRCPLAQDICAAVEPPLTEFGTNHLAACHFPLGGAERTAKRAGL
jgi:oligopeptide/dipeptide ABC transporter ATP-binding protein